VQNPRRSGKQTEVTQEKPVSLALPMQQGITGGKIQRG